MGDEKFKRKNYFIKKGFQLKYTLSVMAMLLVVMAASGLGIYFGMWGSIIENFSEFKVSQNLETAKRIADYEDVRYKKGDYRLGKIFREAELLSGQQQETLKKALRAVNRSLLPKIAILALVIFLAGIFVSHKIAGPMYRIEKSAAAIRNGDLRVSFNVRRNDEMKDATSALGEMVDSLQADFKKIKAANLSLAGKINSVSSQIKPDDAENMKGAIGEIEAILSKYRT